MRTEGYGPLITRHRGYGVHELLGSTTPRFVDVSRQVELTRELANRLGVARLKMATGVQR